MSEYEEKGIITQRTVSVKTRKDMHIITNGFFCHKYIFKYAWSHEISDQ